MKRIIVIYFLFAMHNLFSQNPVLKVYVDTKEINKSQVPVFAFVKSGGKYHSIIRNKDKAINLPDEIEFHKIEGLRFIVMNDTINFPVGKLLEDLKSHPEKNMVDELYAIFKEIAKWELRIDNFKYTSEEKLLLSAKESKKRNSIYYDYKIYSLQTTSLKYYIVKN